MASSSQAIYRLPNRQHRQDRVALCQQHHAATATVSRCRSREPGARDGSRCREFAHIHANPGAGSLHLRLPVDEATDVIDAGWGEWHPFALDGSMPGLVTVYAARDAVDVEAIKLIVGASVDYAGG